MSFTLSLLASLALVGSEDALQSSVVLLPWDGSVAALRALREPGLRDRQQQSDFQPARGCVW